MSRGGIHFFVCIVCQDGCLLSYVLSDFIIMQEYCAYTWRRLYEEMITGYEMGFSSEVFKSYVKRIGYRMTRHKRKFLPMDLFVHYAMSQRQRKSLGLL